jgi:predicted HTH transcriptional regulator
MVMDIWSALERYREDGHVEAKEALGGLPESLWETYSAFANASGGVILLGVAENPDHSFRVLELLDPEELLEEFRAILADPRKVSCDLLTEDDIQILREEGKCIIAIFVPEAGADQKPVYLANDPWRHSYRRVGEADKRCSREEVARMLRGRNPL